MYANLAYVLFLGGTSDGKESENVEPNVRFCIIHKIQGSAGEYSCVATAIAVGRVV